MANFMIIGMVLVLVVMVGQFYKVQVLNKDIQKQVNKFEMMRKSLREDVTFCEQRTANCNADLEREVGAKVDFGNRMKAAEDNAARLQGDMDKLQRNMQQERLALKAEATKAKKAVNSDVEKKMNKMKTDLEQAIKEREDAKKEVEKYHTLYVNGNKLLNEARDECAKLKAAAEAREASERKTKNGKVVREAVAAGGSPGNDRDVDVAETNVEHQQQQWQKGFEEDRMTERQEQAQREAREEQQSRRVNEVQEEAEDEEEQVEIKAKEVKNAAVVMRDALRRRQAMKQREVIQEEEEEGVDVEQRQQEEVEI